MKRMDRKERRKDVPEMQERTSERHDMEPRAFLKRYSVGVYLQDVTALLLENLDESPLEFIAQ